jgi:hypothetical protein
MAKEARLARGGAAQEFDRFSHPACALQGGGAKQKVLAARPIACGKSAGDQRRERRRRRRQGRNGQKPLQRCDVDAAPEVMGKRTRA